nr:hypothetical protein [Pedobacter panaciterrae]
MKTDRRILSDDFINDLAADWYFLNLHLIYPGRRCASEISDELIESGLKLKIILKAGQYTYLQPLNVYVDRDTFFDIWMDADGDIQTSELYCDEV